MRDDLERTDVGKKLPGALYVHRCIESRLPGDVLQLIERTKELAGLDLVDYDVVKVSADGARVSLLAYPEFFSDGFPVLRQSWSLSRSEGQVHHRDYRDHWNPPVLHRKELLLGENHERLGEFALLTRSAEELGLFEDPSSIGLLLQWRETLRSHGVCCEGNTLVAIEPGEGKSEDEPEVFRFRTALRRSGLSTPMQALMKHGYLDGTNSVFDYGCGHGDDLAALEELGVPSNGWDPHFRPDSAKTEADIVNLGFVLNVIEDLGERREALLSSFQLARKLLVVAALVGGRTAYERYRLYRDGVLTARGTFQKYFTQEELGDYLEQNLQRQPIAVAPGTYFVFRDDAAEQAFLASRQEFRPPVPLPMRRERPPRAPAVPRPPRTPRISKWEAARPLLDEFFDLACRLGREPSADEWPRSKELRPLGTAKRVLARLLEERGEARYLQGRRRRIDDLSVYLALNLFERRRSLGALPPSVTRDLRELWGSQKAAVAVARELLFSLGDPRNVIIGSRTAANERLGYLDVDEAFFFHPSVLHRLPAELRVFVGCAARLYGEVESADLVKVHSRTKKLTVLTYDNFEDSPLPLLVERVKVDLRRQDLIFADHSANGQGRQVLYFKSRYIPQDFPFFEDQKRFDAALSCAHFLDLSGFGPSNEELSERLATYGWRLDGFALEMPS